MGKVQGAMGADVTMPDERARAQAEARDLLRDLCDAGRMPDLQSSVWLRAEGALRHLASPGEVHDILTMAQRVYQAEQQRGEYRKAAANTTFRVLMKGLPVLVVFTLAGAVMGRLSG